MAIMSKSRPNRYVFHDTELTLVHVDDYGDGGSEFDVFINGCLNQSLMGTGSGNNWSIDTR